MSPAPGMSTKKKQVKVSLSTEEREQKAKDKLEAREHRVKKHAKVCRFFLVGMCTKGEECPYVKTNNFELIDYI